MRAQCTSNCRRLTRTTATHNHQNYTFRAERRITCYFASNTGVKARQPICPTPCPIDPCVTYNSPMNTPDHIRHQLRQWVLNFHQHHQSDVLIDELCFVEKRNRADLVHANGQLTAYEIKSAADTMQRWPDQHEAYLRVFDTVWLCCHNKHVMKALELSMPQVGVMIVDDLGGMAVLREARQNKLVDPYDLTSFLWREELDELCQEQGLPVVRKERIREARRRIADTLPVEAIRSKVLERLKVRYKDKDYSSSSSSTTP